MENNTVLAIVNVIATAVGAIGVPLTGIAAIISISSSRHKRAKNKRKIEPNQTQMMIKRLLIIGVSLILISAGIFTVMFAQSNPINQKLTTKAWEFYNDKKYEAAISKAKECIDMFGGQAAIKQQELIRKQVPIPNPNPSTEEAKQAIFSRGLLNDVATCYFITGQSNEKLSNKTEALEAYEKAYIFKHAMAWDTGGWFWNVSKASEARIRSLQ